MNLEKFTSVIEEKIVPATDKLTNNRYVKVLMDAFMASVH